MSWTCEYILVACGFFLLLALHFYLKWIESGERRFYLWTWAAFLTGFVAMETNLVFPLLSGSYALLCARKYFRATLPFAAVSAAYAVLHLLLAPNHGAQPYTLHIDGAIPSTLLRYWAMAFEPLNLHLFTPIPQEAAVAFMFAATAALLGFTFHHVRRGQVLAVVFLIWFVALLLPVLPLRDHISDYHLTLPMMALAILGAYALVSAWRSSAAWKVVSVVLVLAYLALSMPMARLSAEWFRERSVAVKTLVMSVARAHELHRGRRSCWMASETNCSGVQSCTGLSYLFECRTCTWRRVPRPASLPIRIWGTFPNTFSRPPKSAADWPACRSWFIGPAKVRSGTSPRDTRCLPDWSSLRTDSRSHSGARNYNQT